MKKILSLLFVSVLSIGGWAQSYSVKGSVIDNETREAIEGGSVFLLKADSSFVSGASTTQSGTFNIAVKSAGKYLVKISYLGYETVFRTIQISAKEPSANLGRVIMRTRDIQLSTAKVTGTAVKVSVVEDTFVYNAAAYRVPEGSTLEALVEKLPGVEVSDDGTVTANGKTVSQILIDGKDFFKGDSKIAMKNLPVELVDKIKAYDKQSDYTKQTGIDDGEEQTVLDINLKQKLKSTWISNLTAGAGTEDRYNSRLFGTRFTDNSRITAIGSMNNVNDRGFGSGGGGRFRNGGSGLTANKMLGVDGMWNNGKKEREAGYLEVGGNVRYNHSSTDSESRSNSETFLTSNSNNSFSNSKSKSLGNSSTISGEFRLEWNPDSMTTITARPSFSHSESNSRSFSQSVTFNDNPYDVEGITDPLSSAFLPVIDDSLRAIMVNTNDRSSLSSGKSDNFGVNFDATRKLNALGRNISWSGSLNYSKSTSKSYSISDIKYFQTDKETNINQFTNNPSKNWNYSTRFSYTEPITKQIFLQASYQFQYRYSDSDRSLYQMADSMAAWGIPQQTLGTLPFGTDSLELTKDLENSQYATYKYYNHNVNLSFRYVTDNINLNVGVSLQPQYTKLDYNRPARLDTVVTRNVFNWAPRVRFRYRFSKQTQLNIRYNGSASQPSMTNLLDVTDDSDPLNISKGNPGLKPSWTNSFTADFRTYNSESLVNMSANASFQQTSNSISNSVEYNEVTGVRTTQPKNINGNWSTNGGFRVNVPFGPEKYFNVSSSSNVSYNNSVGFISVNNSNSQKNTTKTWNLGERFSASYRGDIFEFGLNGSVNYQNSKNKLQPNANLETYTFSYGANTQITLPWNMSIATDVSMNSRRGYNDASMNTNEFLWNAQISQTFLKGSAIVSLQLYDILKEQSNISRTINAQSRTDSWTNAINSYAMLNFTYRLNMFGNGRRNRDGDRGPDRDGDRMRMMDDGPRGGGGPGGGGGFGGGM